MYKVIHYFTDLQDNDYAYHVGDEYPRHGLSVSDTRIKELSGSENKQKTPLISYVEDVNVVEKTYTKTDISRMSKSELVALATENGIANADGISGSELKVMLIEKLV